jgi:hypothetical protein
MKEKIHKNINQFKYFSCSVVAYLDAMARRGCARGAAAVGRSRGMAAAGGTCRRIHCLHGKALDAAAAAAALRLSAAEAAWLASWAAASGIRPPAGHWRPRRSSHSRLETVHWGRDTIIKLFFLENLRIFLTPKFS